MNKVKGAADAGREGTTVDEREGQRFVTEQLTTQYDDILISEACGPENESHAEQNDELDSGFLHCTNSSSSTSSRVNNESSFSAAMDVNSPDKFDNAPDKTSCASNLESSAENIEVGKDDSTGNGESSSGSESRDDEDDDAVTEGETDLEEYVTTWNLLYDHGISKPYSGGGYFSSEDEDCVEISQEEIDKWWSPSFEQGERIEAEDAGDVDSHDAANSDHTHGDDEDINTANYADYEGDDEEGDGPHNNENGSESSTQNSIFSEEDTTVPNRKAGQARKKQRRSGNRNPRKKRWEGATLEDLYQQNLKNGEKGYSQGLAEEIEATFTDQSSKDTTPKGRLICNPLELLKLFLGYLNFHSQFCPSSECIDLTNVSQRGMRELYAWTCGACAFSFKIWSDYAVNATPLHEALVLGTLTAGIGYNVTQEVLSSMGVSCMAARIYRATRSKLTPVVQKVAKKSMKRAAARERDLARKAGHVIEGIPFITVIVDGAWSKRSYKGGLYNALSGVAVIIGQRTGKVL